MIDLRIKDKKDCTACHACLNVCPQACISMEVDIEGFSYPKVNYDKCIECGFCLNACPIINKSIVYNNPKAYACINKDDKVRLKSSSGGIFSLISEEVLNTGGLVFGVVFDERFRAVHSFTDNKEGLEDMRGSKYLQSKIGDTYKLVKKFLKENRNVLFTGTPCQIAGLKSYLSKDYDNLLCLDNICHGVPSPKVWSKYIAYREGLVQAKLKSMNFRNKDKGWKQYLLTFLFDNGLVYSEAVANDLYMRAFISNLSLRPSCYDCAFKSLHRHSDITLADFWGVQNILPDMDDDKGTSLIFVNSDKGRDMFRQIADKVSYSEVDIEEAISYNPSAIESPPYNPNREKFFNELDYLSFDTLLNKYGRLKIFIRLKRRIFHIIKRIFVKFC